MYKRQEAFGAQIVYYSDLVLFKQKFKLKNNSKPANVVAEITYQTCDDRVCLAPNTLEFEQKVVPTSAGTAVVTKDDTPTQTIATNDSVITNPTETIAATATPVSYTHLDVYKRQKQ